MFNKVGGFAVFTKSALIIGVFFLIKRSKLRRSAVLRIKINENKLESDKCSLTQRAKLSFIYKVILKKQLTVDRIYIISYHFQTRRQEAATRPCTSRDRKR